MAFIKKTWTPENKHLRISDLNRIEEGVQQSLDASGGGDYAPSSKGVDNGNYHDHYGGDGGQIAYSSLNGNPSLGDAASKNVGMTSGMVAAGDHGHTGYSTSDHNHTGVYSPNNHDHSSLYSILGHDHASLYSILGHDHAGVYSLSGHDHSGVYSLAAHNHSGVYSLAAHDHSGVYALNANGVTNGDSHDHAGGDGAQINHTGLSNIGTNTHAQIDTFLAVARPNDISSFRRTGTDRPRWYTMPLSCTAKSVSGALTSGRMYAIPFFVPKAITLDYLAVNCTTLGTAAHLRLGIYSDSGNCEPGSLLIDCGAVDTSGTGVKTIACAQALAGGSLYWLAALSDNATHAFRSPALASVLAVIGHNATLPTTDITHFYAAQSYGALPGTFPTVTNGTGIVFPLIYARASA